MVNDENNKNDNNDKEHVYDNYSKILIKNQHSNRITISWKISRLSNSS